MEKGLEEKTGHPLEYWADIVLKSGIEKHGAIVKFLKEEHAFTHGFANLVAHKARQSDAESIDDEELLTNQYKGKEHLMPIYDKLIEEINSFGDDVLRMPKKDSVSMIRKRQFALIKPATKTRIDLGLKLKDFPQTERLGNSGPFGTMCTHRVQLTAVEQLDEELLGWLREAYDRSV